MINRNVRSNSWRDWLIIPFGGGMIIAVVMCWDCWLESRWQDFWVDVIISGVLWSVLSNGNTYLNHWIDQRWTWLHQPVRRFCIGTVGMFAYTSVASMLVLYIFITFYFDADFIHVMNKNGWYSLLKTPLLITVGIVTFMHGRGFLLYWREAAINVEKLKTENLNAKLESLKSQVNPHFLFNSLNTLSSLVYSDQDKANAFIQELSQVYRYVLDHQFDQMVSLDTEIAFAKSFVYLNQIRFGNNLNVAFVGFDGTDQTHQLPPLAVQMLLENCIKHNEISKECPLHVTVVKSPIGICVSNNINALHHPKRDSNGLGLDNIKERFAFLTTQKVIIKHDENQFSVTVPFLTIV